MKLSKGESQVLHLGMVNSRPDQLESRLAESNIRALADTKCVPSLKGIMGCIKKEYHQQVNRAPPTPLSPGETPAQSWVSPGLPGMCKTWTETSQQRPQR